MRFMLADEMGQRDAWRLVSVVGEEAMNELSSFTLMIVSSDDAADVPLTAAEERFIGRRVGFDMHERDSFRYGVVASVEVLPRRLALPGLCLRLTVRPTMWLLTHRRNTRIFQNQHVFEIISKVLGEASVPHTWQLDRSYLRRTYCTQYEETDFEFVTRLMAEEGIFFLFAHTDEFTVASSSGGSPNFTARDVITYGGYFSMVSGMAMTGVSSTAESSGVGGGTMTSVGGLAGVVADAAIPDSDPDQMVWSDASQSAGAGGESATNTDVLCMYDTAGRGPNAQPLRLHFQAGHTGADSFDKVISMAATRSVAPTKAQLRDYNFRRPMQLLEKDHTVEDVGAGKRELEIYEHHSEYELPVLQNDQPERVLEQYRARAAVVAGSSLCPRVLPGFRLAIEDSPAPFENREFTPIRVIHEAHDAALGGFEPPAMVDDAALSAAISRIIGATASAIYDLELRRRLLGEGEVRDALIKALSESSARPLYQNRYELVPADVPFRPARIERKRNVHSESAVVVGPPGQAIHTDRFGRVKIQFHWDRKGKYVASSSCWVRVLTPWAGTGYGFQFVPRVGMEVIVNFLGGDPDRPVVAGAVYNATHATPEPLPERRTRSSIRSQSVPDGAGFNEIAFEDSAGLERVYIHAEKDFHEEVGDEHRLNVKGSQSLNVDKQQDIAIGERRMVAVGEDSVELVGGHRTVQVGGRCIEGALLDKLEQVGGASVALVSGNAVAEVAHDDLKVIRGDHSLTVHGNTILQVGGTTAQSKTNAVGYVQGSAYFTATERVVIKAETWDDKTDKSCLRLECGDSFIQITKDEIKLSAKKIVLNGTDTINLATGTLKSAASDKMELKADVTQLVVDSSGMEVSGASQISMTTTQGATVGLDSRVVVAAGGGVTIRGSSIKLNTGSGSSSSAAEKGGPSSPGSDQPSTRELKLELTHTSAAARGAPLKQTRCRFIADGFIGEATTDDHGKVTGNIPGEPKQVHVIVYANEVEDYKTMYDVPLEWELTLLESDLPAADTLDGARIRLQNLGYEAGDGDEAATVEAIKDFQKDIVVRPSGKLSDTSPRNESESTKTQLDRLYSGQTQQRGGK